MHGSQTSQKLKVIVYLDFCFPTLSVYSVLDIFLWAVNCLSSRALMEMLVANADEDFEVADMWPFDRRRCLVWKAPTAVVCLAPVDVRTPGNWTVGATKHFLSLSSGRSFSTPLLTQSTRLSKVETDSKFMILRQLWLYIFVSYWPDCPHSSVLLPDSKLAKGFAWRANFCSEAD